MAQGPWILGSSILFGIALGTLTFVIPFPSLIFLGVGVCFVLIRNLPRLHQPFLLVGFVLFLVTFWYGQAYLSNFQTLEPKRGERITYRVIAAPEDKGFYQAVRLDPIKSREAAVLWQAPLPVRVMPGDRVVLSCELVLPENFSPDFNYRLYLAKEGVGYICEEATFFEKQNGDVVTKAYQWLYAPRQVLERALSTALPEPEAGLAKGLLLGGDDHLSETIQDQFTTLGLTHIVAVSGYNIVLIVTGFLLFGLTVGLWRRQATALAFFGTAFFVFMIGAPASAVRAGLMAAGAFGAFLIGRMSYSLVAVVTTAALMTLWNPLYLWYDAGFQLSFVATIAVIVAMRAVEGKLSERVIVRTFQEIIWLSVWVYVLLLPLLLWQFKTFTVLSIPANILFLPLVPLAMITSFAVAVVTLVLPASAVLVGWIAYLPLTYILRGTYALSQLPDIAIPINLSFPLVVIWYTFLLFGIVHMEERRKQKWYEKNFQCQNSAHHH